MIINFLNFIARKIFDYLVEQPFIKKKIKSKNAAKIIKLYSTNEYTKSFVKFRFWFGPLNEINKLAPRKGTILDIGSGEGILANYLAINSRSRKILGIEISPHRVEEARKGLKNTTFLTGSVFDKKLPNVDNIVISHVLHHLGSKELQEKLLKTCFKKLKPGGKLIIAEVDRQFSLRYLFGWIVDVLFVPIFFEKKFLDLKIYHRGRKEWKKILTEDGFRVIYNKTTKSRIYPEVIFVVTK